MLRVPRARLARSLLLALVAACTPARDKPRPGTLVPEPTSTEARAPRPAAPFACDAEAIAELAAVVGKVGPAEKAGFTLAVLEQRCGADPRWPAATRLGPEGLRDGLIALAAHEASAWERLCPGLSAARVTRADLPACRFDDFGMRGDDALRYWHADDGEEPAALRALMLGLAGVVMGDHGGLEAFIPSLLHPYDAGEALPVALTLGELSARPALPPEGRRAVEDALRAALAPCYWDTRARQIHRTPASLAATVVLDARGDLVAIRVTESSDAEVAACVARSFDDGAAGDFEAEVGVTLSSATGRAPPGAASEASALVLPAEANAALASAAACLREASRVAEGRPAQCTEAASASAARVRYPLLQGSASSDPLSTSVVELRQPGGDWARFEEVDGAFHGFLWVEGASLYLGYASWYGEREGFVVQVPGSAGLLLTGGPPLLSPRGSRLLGAEVDPYSDNQLRVRAYALGAGAPAPLRRDALDVGHEAERVVAVAFTDEDHVRIELDAGDRRREVRVELGPAVETGAALGPVLREVAAKAVTLDLRRPRSEPMVVLCHNEGFAPVGELQAVEQVPWIGGKVTVYRYVLPCEASWAFSAELTRTGSSPPKALALGGPEPLQDPGGPYIEGQRLRTLGDLVYCERSAADQPVPYGKRCALERGAHRLELASSYGCQLELAADLNADGHTDAIVHTGDDGCERSTLYLSTPEGWEAAAVRDCE